MQFPKEILFRNDRISEYQSSGTAAAASKQSVMIFGFYTRALVNDHRLIRPYLWALGSKLVLQ